jgi:spore coat protein U-like protein
MKGCGVVSVAPLRALLAAMAVLVSPLAQALGVTCSVSATNVTFGVYDPLSVTGLSSTGSVTATCLNVLPTPITIALSTGSSGSYAARRMQSGANTLTYNLYLNAAETQIWGDGTGGSVIDNATITPLLGPGRLWSRRTASCPRHRTSVPVRMPTRSP